MKITSLVDNVSSGICGFEHGLSLMIELNCGTKVLFDMGQGSLFAGNAGCLGLDLSDVDIAVISHGHYDHGGGLETFLELNSRASVFVRESAFDAHYSVMEDGLKDIGIHRPSSDRIIISEDLQYITDNILLFRSTSRDFPEPDGNRLLLGSDGSRDDFRHEQSMMIKEGNDVVLFGGCAHQGIVNIINDASRLTDAGITHVFSGMHIGKGTPGPDYIDNLSRTLLSFDKIQYFTMHCTGEDGFLRLKDKMGDRISYLRCGDSIIV